LDSPAAFATAYAPRAVHIGRVFYWYEEAMRLFKRAPLIWCVLGLITVAADLVLNFVPGIGLAAAKVIVPVIECGMLLGAAAIDRGEPLRVRMAVAVFGARPAALAAIVVSALLIFGVEAWTAYAVAGINLLQNGDAEPSLTAAALASVFGVGTLVSLPLMFVPFAALFEGASFIRAFATSARGFALNILPLLIFGALALVLVLIGLLSYGFGLIAVIPLVSAASYASWKDVYTAATPAADRAS
jgi:hypothetical protein